MDHAKAIREMSVEKYLLGELTGPERDSFEEHLFECQMCAADIDNGVRFAGAARVELAADARERSRASEERRGWFDWLLRPQWMAPSLAACVLLLGYQSVFRIPALQQELQVAQMPKFVDGLSMSSGAVRGGERKNVSAPKDGVFLLTVNLLPQSGYTAYEFELYSPSGKEVWSGTLPVDPARDTVRISVPAAITEAGTNVLMVRGQNSGGTLDSPVRQEFGLEVHP